MPLSGCTVCTEFSDGRRYGTYHGHKIFLEIFIKRWYTVATVNGFVPGGDGLSDIWKALRRLTAINCV